MVFKNIRLKKCKRETGKGVGETSMEMGQTSNTTAMTESSIAYHCIKFLKSE